jgi:uncharacterized RDD family membrane protein YckC
MVNDSVREELETKISVPVRRHEPAPRVEMTFSESPAIEAPIVHPPVAQPPVVQAPVAAAAAPVKREIPRPTPPLKRETNPLSGPKTSPTLVEFQNKNATIPDWRLQLQNSVRQRKGGTPHRTEAVSEQTQPRLMTNGAAALKAEIVEESTPAPAPAVHSNPKIANALKRIDQSRKDFLPEKPRRPVSSPATAQRSYPFNVVSKTQAAPKRTPDGKPVISDPPKPTLVPTFKIDKKKFDTNKLPRIAAEQPHVKNIEEPIDEIAVAAEPMPASVPEISIHVTKPATGELPVIENQEIEDLAPISMRFNAALFDLIIGAFASFVLLSPLVLMGGDWFSFSGIAAFAGVWATAMFIYMTLAIGMHGKTLGMRMFGLELVDAEENDYPTFHQAAVHSAVFLLSLPFLGVGFVPMIFNEERRPAHDLAAGTIIVTEF